MFEEIPIDEENTDKIHYQKINIFGEPVVGKSSLISYLENYENDNFIIEENKSINSSNESSSLVEQIKKIKIELNEDKNLYLNVYEANIDRFDTIRMNL